MHKQRQYNSAIEATRNALLKIGIPDDLILTEKVIRINYSQCVRADLVILDASKKSIVAVVEIKLNWSTEWRCRGQENLLGRCPCYIVTKRNEDFQISLVCGDSAVQGKWFLLTDINAIKDLFLKEVVKGSTIHVSNASEKENRPFMREGILLGGVWILAGGFALAEGLGWRQFSWQVILIIVLAIALTAAHIGIGLNVKTPVFEILSEPRKFNKVNDCETERIKKA